MRAVPLTTANRGMTRLRTKGAARPDTLYDLLNGYIKISGTLNARPGTLKDITLPTDTVGMVAHKCKIYVFSHIPQVTSQPDKYIVAVLRHPTDPSIKIHQIHFQAPYMGFLYVAAEFADGNIWHYWLEELDAWTANTSYKEGDRVFPSTENGFAYEATNPGSPLPAWAPNVVRAVNDEIEPTVVNGFKYKVVSVTGSNPASGDIEPIWPEEIGAQVIEFAAGNEVGTIDTAVTGPQEPPTDEDYAGTVGGRGAYTGRRYATS